MSTPQTIIYLVYNTLQKLQRCPGFSPPQFHYLSLSLRCVPSSDRTSSNYAERKILSSNESTLIHLELVASEVVCPLWYDPRGTTEQPELRDSGALFRPIYLHGSLYNVESLHNYVFDNVKIRIKQIWHQFLADMTIIQAFKTTGQFNPNY